MKITFTNHHSKQTPQVVCLDLATNQVTYDGSHTISREQWLQDKNFQHPLLLERFSPNDDSNYHYAYSSIEELLYAPTFVYKTLIHTENPTACQFSIMPTDQYKPYLLSDEVYLSIHAQRQAKRTIQMQTFKAIIGAMIQEPFEYANDPLLQSTFSTVDLPDTVDADALFETPEDIVNLAKSYLPADKYEFRWIDPVMGFGVFARERIETNTAIGTYNGIKSVNLGNKRNYVYSVKLDALKTLTDARSIGNITRFLNHAPSSLEKPSSAMVANVAIQRYTIRGVEFIFYVTKKTIHPGEQFLIDYGPKYFNQRPLALFKPNHQVRYPKGLKPKLSEKIDSLRYMAQLGVKDAQVSMLLRTTGIALLIAGTVAVGTVLFY